MLHRKRLHLERTRPIRIDEYRPADAVLPHQSVQPRHERRELFGRRMRTCEQRVLQHTPGSWIDANADTLDSRRRRMGFKVEQDERPERRTSRIGAGSCRLRASNGRVGLVGRVGLTCPLGEPELHMDGGSTAVPALQARRERFEKAREHE